MEPLDSCGDIYGGDIFRCEACHIEPVTREIWEKIYPSSDPDNISYDESVAAPDKCEHAQADTNRERLMAYVASQLTDIAPLQPYQAHVTSDAAREFWETKRTPPGVLAEMLIGGSITSKYSYPFPKPLIFNGCGVKLSESDMALDETMTLAEALDFLRKLTATTPWQHALDFSRFVTMLLSNYCMYGVEMTDVRAPAFVITAHSPGAGKTYLANLLLAPFYGRITHCSLPSSKAEAEKTLHAMLYTAEHIVFDNVTAKTANALSDTLAAYLTSSTYAYRLLGTTETTTARRIPIVMCANGDVLSADMEERCMVIHLDGGEDALSAHPIPASHETPYDYMQSLEGRTQMMSALYAIVKHWDRQGRPAVKLLSPTRFPEWFGLFGAMVNAAGLLETGGSVEVGDSDLIYDDSLKNRREKIKEKLRVAQRRLDARSMGGSVE
jgi:hypothetical protein